MSLSARAPSSQPVVQIRVRNLAVGGDGVGEVLSQDDGKSDLLGITGFVPYAGPGEVVEARVTERKKNYLRAEIVSIQESSPHRIAPECRYYQQCGGCELQHLSYEAQLDWKFQMIRSALAAGKCPTEALEKLEPIEPSIPFGYRRRLSLHVDRGGMVGFYRPSSRSIVPISSCSIADPLIAALLPALGNFGPKVASKISSIVLEADHAGVVAVLKSPYAMGKSEVEKILVSAREIFESALVLAGADEVGGFGRRILELPLNERKTLTLRVPAGFFSQVNWSMNMALINAVCGASGVVRDAQIFDLYAGAGNFSLPLAAAGARVTAVESDRRLVDLGRQNISRYSLDRNLRYVESSVEKFLADQRSVPKIDLIIADPPRSGLGNMASQIAFAPRVVLISCHLPSFVRDARALLDQGYTVERIKPFDMFAQTSYVEILSVFSRA